MKKKAVDGTVQTINEAAHAASENWLTRMGPHRCTRATPNWLETNAHPYTHATKIPSDDGGRCSRANISGAATVGDMVAAVAAT
jgi:hypothetical protein